MKTKGKKYQRMSRKRQEMSNAINKETWKGNSLKLVVGHELLYSY